MIYITREDSINVLSLSNRTANCLRREGIHTVGQVLDTPADIWPGIRNMGAKSIDEIENVVEQIRSDGRLVLVETKLQPPDTQPKSPRLMNIPIQELGLSVRAVNCLTSAGIATVAELTGITKDSLMSIKNMGTKTAEEILDRLNHLWNEFDPAPIQTSSDTAIGAENSPPWYTTAKVFSEFTGLPLSALLRCLSEHHELHPAANEEDLCAAIYLDTAVRREVCCALFHLLAQQENGMSRRALMKYLPPYTTVETLDSLLSELEQKKEIICLGEMVERRFPTAVEYVEKVKNKRHQEIVRARLRGETLEEIGNRYDLTRERVRQIIKKAVSNWPKLKENQYRHLFDHYEFSLEEFRLAFDEPDAVYNYLEMTRPKGERKPIQELLGDEDVPIPLRRRAEQAIYKQYITIDGIRVKKTRPELARFVARSYCQDLTTMDTFLQQYHTVLESLGLETDPSLIMDGRTYENKFQVCNYILWSQWHQFRYYPIQERDCAALLETLDLEQYEDQEITSLKLFRDHPDLMEEYDIRDEYELHNLLRKIWPETRNQRVRFKKMPTIVIGMPDRDQQVMDLLVQYAPITNTALAKRYEETYGAKSSTVLGSYFSCIDSYLHNSVYRIDLPPLPQHQQERMAALLTEDYYSLAEIRRLYRREFPQSDLDKINPFSIKQLGFRIYTDYVVSTRFASVSDYFHHLLADEDIVDMRERAPKFSGRQAYGTELATMKSQRTITEFEPKQYINIRRLQAGGVTIADLEDYCSSVCATVRRETYFTVTSLRREGFSHRLDDLGFGEWFYGSVLAEDRVHLSYQRLGGTRIFFHGNIKGNIKTTDFLRWLVEAEGHIDIYDLHKKLDQQYGVELPFHKLMEIVYSSDLYYDAIMETVYIDYDTYLEEI